MKKITKILAILVSMTLVCNLQALSVFGEEILPDPMIETEAKAEADESIMPEETETENELRAGNYTREDASYSLTYAELDDGTIKITECEGTKSGELIIPSEIEEKAVTVIGDGAFYHCDGFTGNLTIPDSVTTIGSYAFENCSGFTGSLTIPDSVTEIGEHAFQGCSGFTEDLTIGDSVMTIGKNAFSGCSGFTGSLTIGDSVTTIGEDAFSICGFTGDLTVGGGFETIEEGLIASWGSFTGSLTIGEGIKIIGENAFSGYGFTGSLTIGDSVTTIGKSAFQNCSFTGDLTIPDSVESIGESAFEGCSGFTGSLTIGDSVTTIGDHAFDECSGFTGSLTIGDSVTTIGDHAFDECSGFTGSLTIPDSVTTIGTAAFYKCSGFTGSLTIGDSVESIEWSAFEDCSGFTGSLTIGDSVTTIGDHAFDECSGFTGSLTIPDSVTTIGTAAFYFCSGFTGSLTIPEGVESIGGSAFEGCNGFTGSLTIPDSVSAIGVGAFGYCSGFTGSLTIPDSVTTIGRCAFENCRGFTGSLTIPEGVESIGEDAFLNCTGFRKVVNRSERPCTLLSPAGQTWINAKTGEQITGSPATITNGTAIRSDYYAPVDAPYFTHDPVGTQTYTGKAIKPAVKVYFGTNALEEKTDYTIKFANNTNAGMASFIVTGKGNYAGNDSDSFEILKKNLTDDDITFTEPAAAKYTKKEQKPVPKITYNGMTLKKGKDFEIAYFSDECFREWCTPKEPGKYYLKITGTGNYEGELDTTFVIVNPKKKPVSTLKADKIADKLYANGEAIELTDEELVIRDGKTPLTKGTEYEIVGYSDNTLPGTAKVTIRGIEEKGYVGKLTLTFKIKGTPISKATITAPADVTYNGSEQESEPEVKLNDTPLIKDTDYELIYDKNKNVGKAKVIIKGKGGYTGSVSKTFTIKPAMILPDMITLDDSCTYTGSDVKPVPVIKLTDDIILREGKDYTVKYANNTAVTGASTKQPMVTITGKGNYTGKQVRPFVIIPADIDSCTVAVDDVVYKDKNGNWKPKKVTVLGTGGKALKAGKDYDDKTIRYTLEDDEEASGIEPGAKLDAGTMVYVWVEAKGTNYNAGTVKGTYRIMKQDIGKLSPRLIQKPIPEKK